MGQQKTIFESLQKGNRNILRAGAAVVLAALLTTQVSAGGGVESRHTSQGHDSEHEVEIPRISRVEKEEDEALSVVATTSMIGDVAAHVGGEFVDLTVLVPRGQNPHGYEPAPTDLAEVERAHIVLTNGFGLEEALLDAIESVSGGYIVPVSAGVEPVEGEDHEAAQHEHGEDEEHHDEHDEDGEDHEGHDAEEEDHDHGPVDPHVWFDPTNVMVWTKNIVEVFAQADPDHAETYRRQGTAYMEELQSLDTWIRGKLSDIPEAKRVLVTDHRLFSYFAEEYGFEVVGTIIPSTTTSAQVSAKRVAELVELLEETGVRTLFVGMTAGRGLEKLAGSIGAEIKGEARIVRTLTGSLTEPGTPGDSYIEYMRYNVERIIEGLTSS